MSSTATKAAAPTRLQLTAKQRHALLALSSPDFTRYLFDGGSRSGKTVSTVAFLVDRAIQYPGSRQLIVRKCLAHARTSIWHGTLRDYLRDFMPPGCFEFHEQEMFVRFSNGSEIWLGGLDDKERTEKILGNEYLTAFVNEATQVSYEAVQMVMTRLAQNCRHVKSGAVGVQKLILDCNPRGPRHWLHRYGVQKTDPETRKPLAGAGRMFRLQWSAFDNQENLSPTYIETLENLPPVTRDRMLNGVWRENEGAVYDEFNEDVHVVEPFAIPDSWRRVRAVDFGYTNPFVCLWGALDGDGRLYVYRERYKAGARTIDHAKAIVHASGGERIECTVADHDASDRADMAAGGVQTRAAKKDVIEGIQAVKKRLVVAGDGKPRLLVFPCCANLLAECYEYIWEPPKEDREAKEEPRKDNDHAMDALRYLVMHVDKTAAFNVASGRLDDGRWG